MMDKVPMTAAGFQRLQDDLKHLKGSERPAIIRAIAEAREHGDLSENAEYHAARERQSFIEGQIGELEDRISRAEVIEASKLSGNTVKFGATVTLVDEDTDEEVTYQLVGEFEADINAGLENTINVIWNELKYKVTLHKELEEIPMIRCYPGQLNQVFMNLLVNSSHAIEKQGEITVRTGVEDPPGITALSLAP